MQRLERAPVDAEVRVQALDPQRSFIVQAPAGSGKTELLTQRYLTLLASVDEPEEILAITFTKKAAGEMRIRIARALDQGGEESPAESHKRRTWELAKRARERDRIRGWNIARHPARLRIQTIDSLNSELTRRMPLLSQFGAQPGIAERPQPLYEEAARRTLARLEGDGGRETAAVQALLLHLDNSLPRVIRLVADMLPRRDQWLRHTGAGSEVRRTDLENALREEVRYVLQQAIDSIPAGCRRELAELAGHAGTVLHGQGKNSAITDCAGLKSLPGTTPDALPTWRGIAELLLTQGDDWRRQINANQGFPPEEAAAKARVSELLCRFSELENLRAALVRARRLPEPRYPDAQWQVLEALLSLLPLAVAELQVVFMERGEVDYAEVALRALQALGTPDDPTDLTLTLDHRLRHVLVDEFQDTSVNQTELLKRLTAGWQPGDGRTLFVVGDPMQSIYRFREAEVGLFLRARQNGIGGLNLAPLTLSANFRSQAGLVHWFNRTFEQLFPSREDVASGAVRYAGAMEQYAPLEGEAVQVHAYLEKDPERESREVAEIIVEVRRRNPDTKLAVLARARGHLAHIVRRLRMQDVPFRAVELESLGERPVVQDLLALTRALLHPADRTAWLAVLRAPWCGLSLAALHALCEGLNSDTLPERLRDAEVIAKIQPLTGEARFEIVRKILLEVMETRRRGTLREQVESVWLKLAAPATLKSVEDLADAEAYLELLEALDEGGELRDPVELDAALEKLFARPDPRADESLQLMTVHKAKGLEFDVVIVPGLAGGPGRRDKLLLTWLERPRDDGRNDLLLAPLEPSGGEKDPLYQFVQSLRREQEQMELTRLLYVAATRARERLCLFGHATVAEKDGERVLRPPRTDSLLGLLWPVVRRDFGRALERRESGAAVPAEPMPAASLLNRLRPDWRLPVPDASVEWVGAETLAAEEREDMEFQWVGDRLRHVGTVVHRLLQRIAGEGPDAWEAARVKRLTPLILHWLRSLGVPTAELDAAAQDVTEAVTGTLADSRGRWILDPRHIEARSEYALNHFEDHRLETKIIDRTFVDAEGTRWIVDYKTGRHHGGDVEAFLEQEKERYRDQIEGYARLLRGLEERRVKVGLYFPLMRRFLEWEPEDG